jgi:hypothetical protein
MVYLLKYLLAIELYRSGLTKEQVRARLKLAKEVINQMLLGVKPPKGHGAE